MKPAPLCYRRLWARRAAPTPDIDPLLLSAVDINEALNQKISPFIAKLWDIGIDPALAVRSVAECDAACRDDITIATSLLEARILGRQ